jgi:hypothetical protein
MVLAYRSDEDALQARLGSLLDERSAEVASTAAALRGVYASRVARAVAGSVAALGGAAVLLGGAVRCLTQGFWFSSSAHHGSSILTQLLLRSVAASALVYLPARDMAASFFSRALRDELSLSGNARIDLVRVERAQPRRIARRLIEDSEASSASLPLIGSALLAPLALHALVWLLLSGLSGAQTARSFEGFDAWIVMSAPLAGLAHLALALLGGRFGSKLRAKPTAELVARPAKDGWYALKITALAGLFPGLLLIMVPPVLIGLTGLLFIPLSFYAMSRAIVRERDAVDAQGE